MVLRGGGEGERGKKVVGKGLGAGGRGRGVASEWNYRLIYFVQSQKLN